MNEQEPTSDESARPWWHVGAEAVPDVEALLGPDGMAAVGGVADEALKLFVVLRERFVSPPSGEQDQEPGSLPPGSAWSAILGQLASGAVKAVNEITAAAADRPVWAEATAGSGPQPGAGSSAEPERGASILPGEAAACSYCPVCQAISLFRSVPMSTWQRLATSIVDVADAARDFAGAAADNGPEPIIVTPQPAADAGDAFNLVSDFLRSLEKGSARE